MRWKRYPAYKGSGVEWLGEVPEHWDVAKLKWFLELNDGGAWGDELDDSDVEGTIVLRSTELLIDGSWSLEGAAVRKLSESEKTQKRLKQGDIVVTKSSGSTAHIGKAGFVTQDIEQMQCCFSNFMQRLRARNDFSSRFLFWVLNGAIGREQMFFFANTTTGLRNLSESSLSEIMLAMPDIHEQILIASYLDIQSTSIDTLISKKQLQLELLEEKRTALITHAVTKGLDPNVKMKDSGVEWLGEVPEHWGVSRLKWHAIVTPGYAFPSEEYVEGIEGVPLVRIGDITQEGDIDLGNAKSVPRDMYRKFEQYRVCQGDILMAMTGATVGKVGVYSHQRSALLNQRVCRLDAREAITNRWLWYSLQSRSYREFIKLTAFGGAQPNISEEQMTSYPIAIPDDPIRITDFLDNETTRMDDLRDKIQQSIDTLQEYRSALISAAVTGQIDVREEVV